MKSVPSHIAHCVFVDLIEDGTAGWRDVNAYRCEALADDNMIHSV